MVSRTLWEKMEKEERQQDQIEESYRFDSSFIRKVESNEDQQSIYQEEERGIEDKFGERFALEIDPDQINMGFKFTKTNSLPSGQQLKEKDCSELKVEEK